MDKGGAASHRLIQKSSDTTLRTNDQQPSGGMCFDHMTYVLPQFAHPRNPTSIPPGNIDHDSDINMSMPVLSDLNHDTTELPNLGAMIEAWAGSASSTSVQWPPTVGPVSRPDDAPERTKALQQGYKFQRLLYEDEMKASQRGALMANQQAYAKFQ